MFGKQILVSLAVGASYAAAQLAIATPASIQTCVPVALTWSGGTGPYYVAVIPGGQTTATALLDFGQQSGTSYTWTDSTIAAGTSITLRLTDSTGTTVYSAPNTIQSGSTSCFSSSGSSSASGSATSSASVLTSTSSGAVGSTTSLGSSALSSISSAASAASASSMLSSRATTSASSSAASSSAASSTNRVSSALSSASSAAASAASSAISSAAASATGTSDASPAKIAGAGAVVIAAIGGFAALF